MEKKTKNTIAYIGTAIIIVIVIASTIVLW